MSLDELNTKSLVIAIWDEDSKSRDDFIIRDLFNIKIHLQLTKLSKLATNQAYDNVNEETRKLDLNTERACDSVNAAFTEFQQMLEKRRAEVLQVDELRYHMTAEFCQFIRIEVGFSLHIG